MALRILSIRLSADGLSFWTGDSAEGYGTDGMTISKDGGERITAGYPIPAEGSSVAESVAEAVSGFRGILAARDVEMPQSTILYADNRSTVLVPEQVFRDDEAAEYLYMHGFTPAEGHYMVYSRPIHGTVAITVLEQAVTAALGQALGEFAVVSPLQYNLCTQAASGDGHDIIRIYATPMNCYITVFKQSGVEYADVHPLSSAADLVYYLDWLAGRYGGGDWTVKIDGHGSEELASLAAKRFKGTVCG